MGGIIKDLRSQLFIGNGMPDHVHLLVRYSPDLAHSELTREVKARSFRWIHEAFPSRRDFAWQRGYGGFTVSRSNADEVEAYIRDQEEHHRAMTFQEEFLALLRRHGVDLLRIWQPSPAHSHGPQTHTVFRSSREDWGWLWVCC